MKINEVFKAKIWELQTSLLKAGRLAEKLILGCSDEQANDMMDDLMVSLENACITARATIERYRPLVPMNLPGRENAIVEEIAGNLEVTPDGCVHITLNTLLPHCKYKTSPYLQDTVTRLVENYPGVLPKYDSVFLAIVEHCNHENRRAFDNDNKGWKSIPNALKTRLFDDDDQFHLSLGLFGVLSDDAACHIYVMPLENASDFMFSWGQNIYELM
ncbi:MAG: hypothetical protein LBT12_06495 [Oscillospiraceae bacterium]|jgi:hypothetical protein|nr:hypothetical protein [Oscillospiraceae bacterium]